MWAAGGASRATPPASVGRRRIGDGRIGEGAALATADDDRMEIGVEFERTKRLLGDALEVGAEIEALAIRPGVGLQRGAPSIEVHRDHDQPSGYQF